MQIPENKKATLLRVALINKERNYSLITFMVFTWFSDVTFTM